MKYGGRTKSFPVTQRKDIVGLAISPIGVVEDMKRRVTHDLILGGGASRAKSMWQ